MNKRPQPRPSAPRRPQEKRQTPPPLTEQEIARRRARAEAARRAAIREAEIREKIKKENKERRLAAAKLFFYRFLVYLVMLAIMLSVFSMAFYFNLTKTVKPDTSDFTYYLADEKKAKLPYDSVMRGDAVYVNLSQIAEKFNVTVTGNYDKMRFISDSNEEYIILSPNSHIANVNGNRIILSAPAILEEKCLWVPIDLVTEHIDGISLKHSEKERKITVKRLSYGAQDKEISFWPKPSPATPNIPESEDFGSIEETK